MTSLFDAHNRLSTCRTANGEIPWTAIDEFIRRNQIADRDFFEDCLFAFERVRAAIERKRAPKPAPVRPDVSR